MEKKQLTMKTSILWNSWGSIFYLGCQWLLSVLVVWLGGYGIAGNLSLAMTISNTFYNIASYGMRNYQISDTKPKYQTGSYIFSRLITCGISMVLCVGFVFVNSYDREQQLCIIIYMVFKLTEALFDVYAGIFQKAWRLDYVGKSMTIRGVLSLVSFSGVLWLTKSLVASITAMAVVTLGAVLVYDVRIAARLTNTKLVTDLKAVRMLLIECIPLVLYVFMASALGSVPRYFLELYEGNVMLGYYASIATPTLIVQMASTYIFNPFVTVFAEKYNDNDEKGFWGIIGKCILALAAVSVAAVIGALVFGRLGLRILYGTSILKYSYLLIPLILCTILTAFAWLLGGILTVVRDFRGLLAANIAGAAVCVAASVFFIGKFGMQGANMALGTANLVVIFVSFFFLVRNTREHFRET